MPGTETQQYDLVIEFAEHTYRDLLAAIFDSNGFLCNILDNTVNKIPGVSVPCGVFTVDVLFDRPTDVTLPAGANDFIDIRIGLGENGSAGNIRLIIGLDVDRSSPDIDLVGLDCANRLYYVDINIGPATGDPFNLLSNFLKNDVKSIPLLPVPVDRTSGDATKINSADIRIIDDTSPSDLDASAVMLTFGGGTPGNRNGFARSFVSPGGDGGIAIFFGWLCRIISPLLESSLSLPDGSFVDCHLNRTVRIDQSNEVDLTQLDLSLVDGAIKVTAEVTKSGFCYTATGKVWAEIKIVIQDGQLIVQSHVDDPDISVDIPWYCYLAAAVIGAVLGGILGGVIGAIVGAVIGPLITWIASEVIEGLVQNIADRVVNAINGISPSVNVPAVGINIIFSDVFIDDVVIACAVDPQDNAPVRSEGTLVLANGQFADLDNGRVGDQDLPGADLAWEGALFYRDLRTVCSTAMARSWSTSFDRFTRSRLYNLYYEVPTTVPLSELVQIDPWPFGEPFDPRMYVYGVRTNEDRYAEVQAIHVDWQSITLRYRTYEKFLPTLEIKGEFRCESVISPIAEGTVTFEPALAAQTAARAVPAAVSGGARPIGPGPVEKMQELCDSLTKANQVLLPRQAILDAVLGQTSVDQMRIGRWTGRYRVPSADVGRFDAIINGLTSPIQYEWQIAGHQLAAPSGSVSVEGTTMSYTVDGGRLVLTPQHATAFEFEIRVTAKDAAGTTLINSRCVKYVPTCVVSARHIPDYQTYCAAYMAHFGIAEVAPSEQPPRRGGAVVRPISRR